MFSRFILKPSNFRFAARICARDSNIISFNLLNNHDTMPGFFQRTPIFYSTNRNGNNNNGEDPSRLWNVSSEIDKASNSLFDEESTTPFDEFQDPKQMKSEQELHSGSLWKDEPLDTDFDDGGFFKEAEEKGASETTNEWDTAAGFKMWDLEVEEKKEMDSFFADVGEVDKDAGLTLEGLTETDESKKIDEQKQLEVEEKVLDAVLKGPDRAFGDLLAASGITDEMLDSLIALKDLEGIQGLPPLHDIQDERYENSLRKSSRAEMERQKQEEVAKARVRQVDDKGRAYGTGRRKCSIARVWIQPGDGRFVVNDKEFDVYFPMLDHRATLLRPFTETVTLGKWDVNCTVKGGGVSGQVGAVRLGISRALQNWAPDLRPPLREAGFLTRDPRVVERKKPGKAKARKSFQWVKR